MSKSQRAHRNNNHRPRENRPESSPVAFHQRNLGPLLLLGRRAMISDARGDGRGDGQTD
jgi:hypothetical protein